MKSFFKKALLILTVLVMGVSATACGGDDDDNGGGNGGGIPEVVVRNVEVTGTNTSDTVMTMQNGNIKLKINKSNGSVISVVYLGYDADFISNSVGGNFAVKVDTTTSNAFESNENTATVISSRDFAPIITVGDIDDGKKIELLYNLSAGDYTGLKVTNTITMKKGEMTAAFDYKIDNSQASKDSVVVNITGAQLTGIKDATDQKAYDLFWPYKEGKLYTDVIKRINDNVGVGNKMTAAYPVPFSMQLVQLYNGKQSLDYAVLDTKSDYKKFNFGEFRQNKDHDSGVSTVDKISLSNTQYPFVKSGESINIATTSIGVSGKGDWYDGSDRYRSFLVDNQLVKQSTQIADDFMGMNVLIAENNMPGGNGMFASYMPSAAATDYTRWISEADEVGIDMLCAIGWNESGFDSMYPDYEFSEAQGGAENFSAMTTKLHNNGDSLMAYINGHIADIGSRWSTTNITKPATDTLIAKTLPNYLQSAVKSVGFKFNTTPLDGSDKYTNYMDRQVYGALESYAMCPMSEEYINSLNSAIRRLRDNGTDAIWFDQIMEMPSHLCYDQSHGHKTPATAYSEGYKKMFAEFDKSMQTKNTFYMYSSEGVCDAYIRYIDVCGMMWQRKFGGLDRSNTPGGMGDNVAFSAEITRYTMPSRMLGLEGAGTTQGAVDEFARSFLFANPILASNYQRSISALTSIYVADKDIFTMGRYMHDRGIRYGKNSGIMAAVNLSKNGKDFAISAYNTTASDKTDNKIIIDLKELGITSNIVKITDLMTGNTLTVASDNSITFDVSSKGIKSFKVECA